MKQSKFRSSLSSSTDKNRKTDNTSNNYSTTENLSKCSKKKKLVRKLQGQTNDSKKSNDTSSVMCSLFFNINSTNNNMNSINESSIYHDDKFYYNILNADNSLLQNIKVNILSSARRSEIRNYENYKENINLCEINNSTSVLEIKNHSQYSDFEISEKLFEMIQNATENSEVILPPRYVTFPHLVIEHSLRIKGSPGTLVEVHNGMIIISNKTDKLNKVSISECSFVFNLEVKTFFEKMKTDELLKTNVGKVKEKYSLSLVQILPNCSVEVNDCDFRAIVHEDGNILDESIEQRTILETLFCIHNKSFLNSELCLRSTICSNFYRILEAHDASQVVLDHCLFSETLFNVVYLQNVKDFKFLSSKIISSMKGIEICFSKELNSSIKICDSEFTQNQNFAIQIYSDLEKSQIIHSDSISVEINKNVFFQNKNSLIINNFKSLLHSLEILCNEVSNNLENGIDISNIDNPVDKYNKFDVDESFKKLLENSLTLDNDHILTDCTILILGNKIQENKTKFGLKLYNINNVKLRIEGNEIISNLTGVSIDKISNSLIILKDNLLKDNLDMGALLHLFSPTVKVFFDECKVKSNFSYGISLLNSDIENDSNTSKTFPVVYIKNSKITNNKKGGIQFTNFSVSIENTQLIDNCQWAVEMPQENNKTLLKLLNYDSVSLNRLINNPIGGKWGLIENKKSICSNSNCSIL